MHGLLKAVFRFVVKFPLMVVLEWIASVAARAVGAELCWAPEEIIDLPAESCGSSRTYFSGETVCLEFEAERPDPKSAEGNDSKKLITQAEFLRLLGKETLTPEEQAAVRIYADSMQEIEIKQDDFE